MRVDAGSVSRRQLVSQLAAAGGALALASCAGPGSESGKAQQAKAPVILEAWSPWEGTPADWARRHTAFQEAYPYITIQWTGTGFSTYLDKVTTAVTSGTAHDLSYLDNQHQGFFGRNKLVVDQGPLGKKDKDFRVDQIEPKALDLFTYDGAVLGYPWMLTIGQVFFNRAIFQAAGHPTPEELYKQGKWTWEAMTQAAVALTRRGADGKAEVLGLSHMSIWRLALNSNGTDMFDDFRRPKRSRLDEPEAIQAIENIHDVAHKHRAAWKQPEATDLGGNANEAMNQGKLAMHVSWGVPWPGWSRYAQVWDKMGWVPFPKGPAAGGKTVADLTTEVQGIMRASKTQEAAWLYAKWYEKDWQRAVLEEKSSPGIASRRDLLDLSRAILPPPQDLWFEMARSGVARPVFPDWNKVNGEILNVTLNPVWGGEAAPRQAALNAAKQLNDFLAANPQ